MMKKVTLLFAALMITLGVSAQEGTTVEERGAAKGYYPFAAKVTEMEQITSLDQLTDGMEIMIKHSHEGTDQDDHEGSYLTINSLSTGGEGGYHNVFMHSIPTGVGVWTTDAVGDGSYQLKSAHMTIVDGAKCYLGYPRYDSNLYDDVITTLKNDNFSQCTYKFETTGDGRWALKYTYETRNYIGAVISQSTGYLCVTSTSGKIKIVSSSTLNENCYFNVYQVKEKSAAQIKYVETTVKLTGAAGNIFTTDHAGWNDFYEFSTESYDSYSNYKVLNNYGVALSNVYYHEESNEITGGIRFPFSVSGKIAKIPVHLCSYGDTLKRFAVGENNTVKVITRPDNPTEGDGWFKNQENQWYIYPQFDEEDHMVYSIQNVATGQYLYSELNSDDLKLSATPTYFKLYQTAPSGNVRFSRPRTSTYATYLSFLCETNGIGKTTTSTYSTNVNFAVPRVSGEEAGGYDAIGFTRTYHSDTYFWDGGEIAMDDAPADLKAVFEDENHEGYDTEGSEHRIYTANTGIYVPKMGDVTVTFNYLGGTDRLTILGVDIVDALGDIVSSEYHLGYAGVDVDDNVYVVKDVPVGNYFLRYWVCNRTDWENEKNHNLSNNSGQIIVEGADYYLTYSDAPTNGAFSSNSTWYRMRLSDGLEKYISAQPNYVDAANNLMVTNDTPPNDYAGLWAIVGDEENGYKFYNRAWGPEYAMKTEGENGDARTYMVPVAEASTYDIVQQDRSTKDYKFYVKLHGTDNYLNDHANSGYLATWNTSGALGNSGSVMTFETLNMEVFEANTTIVKNNLIANWNPWVGNPKVSDFVKSISNSFAQLMLKRNDFSILDGKVFMFVNKGPVDDGRQGRVLRVDANNNMAGVVSQGDLVDDFLQIVDNGDGTFKLLHLATNKYFQKPNVHTITENAADAAAYSYKVYGDEVQALCFISGNEMMHLGNWGYGYTTINNNNIASGASRWDVIYDVDAQELADLIARAKARYAATQEDAYQANVGVPGYANADSTTALLNTFNGGLAGMTFAEATTALTNAMNGVSEAEKAVFFPTDCYFTLTNERGSLVYDAAQTAKDEDHNNSDYLWCSGEVDATNPSHLWGFYQDAETGEYYLYNVGKLQFANAKGKGSYGDTWIFSNSPVAITMEALDAPYFHIMGAGKTMSISGGYVGPVITYYAAGDEGIPFQFKKSEVPVDQNVVKQVESLLVQTIEPGFYIFKCDESLYLNDKPMKDDTRRTVTALTANKIDNIFYHTEDSALVGYASGFGFVYGHCNTGNPADGYNTFTFKTAYDPEKIFLKADQGKSIHGWADRYITVNEGILVENNNKRKATAWTIEKVTELPVKFNDGKDGYAYATLYTPVALNIPATVEAYTGVVEGSKLVLTALDGVIPAGTGVVLRTDAGAGTYNFEITTSDLVSDADNVLKGDVFSQVNDGLYYSLANVSGVAFYKYTGKNLTGFRARVSGDEVGTTQPLTFSFRNTTGIEEVTSVFQSDEVYDLSGRRVTSPVKGLYIVNGKKVFIK